MPLVEGIRAVVLLAALGGAVAEAGVAAAWAEDTSAAYQALAARMLALEQAGDAAGALTLLWDAAERAPRDPHIQLALGESLERLGALDAAVAAFRRALDARPGLRRAEHRLVLTLVKNGQGREAAAWARARAAATPNDPDVHFLLGLAQSEQDVAEAIAAFRRALSLAPHHALARYNLALVLKRADRAEEAIAELRATISREPRAEAFFTLGIIHWQRGDRSAAAAALQRAVALAPDYADAQAALGTVLLEAGDLTGAAAALQRAVTSRPDVASTHYTLARVEERAGRSATAAAHRAAAERIRRAGEREQEARAWTTVGIGRFEAGDLVQALDAFRRAATVDAAYAPAHFQMGRTLERLGELDAARSAFERARQLNPVLGAAPDTPRQ